MFLWRIERALADWRPVHPHRHLNGAGERRAVENELPPDVLVWRLADVKQDGGARSRPAPPVRALA
jgi:hypothetical protein